MGWLYPNQMLHCSTAVPPPNSSVAGDGKWSCIVKERHSCMCTENLSETSLSQSPSDTADVIPTAMMFMEIYPRMSPLIEICVGITSLLGGQ